LGAAGEQAAGVTHAEADHVAEPVREKQSVRLLLNQRSGITAHHAHGHETSHQVHGTGKVDVAPLGPGTATITRALLGAEHDLVEVTLV
jgi:hypothetical protein